MAADVQVVIVEDDPDYREAVALSFSRAPGHAVAGTFCSALAAVEAAQRSPNWDVAFLDIEMPGMDGIEGTRQLKELLPELKVVILTVFEQPARIVQAICAGADGYLLKKNSGLDLVAQVEIIRAGGATLTGGVARVVLDLLRTRLPEADRPAVKLSPRQVSVLRLLVDGRPYKQIADELGISLDTVRTYVRDLYRKLQVQNAAGAVTRALREGLV